MRVYIQRIATPAPANLLTHIGPAQEHYMATAPAASGLVTQGIHTLVLLVLVILVRLGSINIHHHQVLATPAPANQHTLIGPAQD